MGTGETLLLPLRKPKHVNALQQHGALELPYPLLSGSRDGSQGFWIDADTAPIITPDSLRIFARNLVALAYGFDGGPGMKAEALGVLRRLAIKCEKPPPPEVRLSNKGSAPISGWLNKAPRRSDWILYLNLPDLALWEAIALSLNILPSPDMRERINKDFDNRLRIALAHLGPTGELRHVA